MAVPFIDLKRFEPGFLERWAEKAEHVTRNTMFVGGPEAGELERRLKERSEAAAVVGCANGTDALQLALRAAGVEKDDVVLLPDATFWATFEAVVNVGARPVTVDVNMDDLQMDYDYFVEAAESYRPKAAILVHLYGWASARLEQFRNFCRERDIALVEDGAQSFGTTYRNESLYKGALLSTCSFYPAKVLGSCGDAGAVYCESGELAEKVRRLGNHGRSTHYGHSDVGWNSRLGGFDAAYLNLSLDYIEQRLESRRRIASLYRRWYRENGVRHVEPPEGYCENGYLTVALVDPEKRPQVREHLAEKGIGSGVVYPGAMSKQPGAKGHLKAQVGGANADLLCRSVLNLPLFAHMRDEEFHEVVSVFEQAL